MKKNTQCYFTTNNVKQIDYKDVDILKKFLTPHARMITGERTAIKRSRFMGLLPFVAK
ncbi:MAG: 30S ribosomal protein S18 [Candidatus Nomurabacteria bacterium GW2011_GWC2_42_20]|uniref:30S ribosomal protein S18 n=1 Tax=Candidatus Nomurabacteria bacterium GW2011_GWC2_42_20 TaxID=1618756 RepID=A0A0G0ZEG3_9BACT|nr:MAG: 30S ribosomal protein S18 [Candidatus Nomurabacteria bacterium GW2011_GWC2_42_20]